jgi:outer membrane receptor protein involved in Fe transport
MGRMFFSYFCILETIDKKRMKKILIFGLLLGAINATAQTDTTAYRLENIVVTGTRNKVDVRHLPFAVTVVGREKLTENYRPSLLPTLSEQVPGLFTTSRGIMGYGVSTNSAGGINLRGVSGGAGQMMVLIDGHPQYQGIYGHPIADSYQTMMADRVEVLRGPASVLYGSNAMGGVVNIVTRNMHQDGISTQLNLGAGSYGTVQAEASNQVRAGRFSSTIAAQYGRSDNHRPRMGFEQYGGYLKLAYDLDANWSAFADADITHFNASNPGLETAPLYDADQWITRGAIAVGIENHYDNTSGRLSVYDNFGRHKINDGWKEGASPSSRYFRSNDRLLGVSWYQSSSLFTGNRTTVGVDYQHIYGRAYYTSIATGEELNTPNKQSGTSYRNEIAAYADFRQDLLQWLTVDAGLRLDHHSITGTELIPQGGIVVRPIATAEVKASVSKGFRNPTMREMYLYPPSNTELEPERMMTYELAWKHHLMDKALSYGVNFFYIKGDNMIQQVRIDGKPRNVNTGEIENHGVELEAAYSINSHWRINTNHSYLHMKSLVLGAPEYKGYIGANWHQNRWTVNSGLQLISGLVMNTATESKESFSLLNATVAYRLTKQVSLWAKGDNLLGQEYEVIEGFPMPRATFMGGVNVRF